MCRHKLGTQAIAPTRQSSRKFDGPAFDTVEVEGLATLAGKLVIHLAADVPFQAEASDTTPADPDYYPPVVGDTWDIIKGVSGGTITGTFSGYGDRHAA